MAASMQMLSVKLFLVTHRLSWTLYAPRRFPIHVFRRGPQVDDLRRSSGGLPCQPAHSRWYCLATNGAYEAPVESNELEDDCDDNEITGEEDFRKFQQIDKSRSRVKDGASSVPQNYLELTDKELFAQCKMDTYRASGPGGQHRNKTDSAVRLKHIPTGLVTQASEDRSQHNNRAYALGRLRQLIATEVRGSVELEGYKPPVEVVRILPFEKGARKDRLVQKIGPNHPDFAQGVKGLLDLLEAVGGSVSDAAAALGLTTGALSKLITSDKVLWQGANKIRASKFVLARYFYGLTSAQQVGDVFYGYNHEDWLPSRSSSTINQLRVLGNLTGDIYFTSQVSQTGADREHHLCFSELRDNLRGLHSRSFFIQTHELDPMSAPYEGVQEENFGYGGTKWSGSFPLYTRYFGF